MILLFLALVLAWKYRRMHDALTEKPRLDARQTQLWTYAGWVLIAFASALVLSTGCNACVAGAEAGGMPGWAAWHATWAELLEVVLWIVIAV